MSVWDASFGSVFVSNSEKNDLYYSIHIKKDLLTTQKRKPINHFFLFQKLSQIVHLKGL